LRFTFWSMRQILLATCVPVSTLLCARSASAQWGVWAGDSLLAAGRLASAESAYYAAARARPRDPIVRTALGKFLAARGGTRAGAVLLEEAQFFGGDSISLARALVPLYERLGDFAAIDSLRPNVLMPSERKRVHWLKDRPPQAALRDSVVLLSYRPVADGDGFGTVLLRLGKTEIPAMVDPRAFGLVVPAAMRRDLRTFGTERGSDVAVADVVRIGGIVFSNVPTTIGSADDKVRLGFDVLAPYSPSFDPRKGLMVLRRPNRRAQPQPGLRVPALFDNNGVRLLIGGHWQPSSAAMPAMLLATRAWTWDGKYGDVVLLP